MKQPWRGKPCAVCGKTNGYFQRATYQGAPDGGIPVHQECLGKFWQRLENEEWREFMPSTPVNSNQGITVIDVFNALRIEPVPKITWAVGNAVRDLYKSRNNNELPPKALRQKTNADGTHCFATYPTSYFKDIERIIRRYKVEEQRQGELF